MKNTKPSHFFTIFMVTIILTITNVGTAYAVKIIPPRLVIDPETKIEYMFIKNGSDKPETYRFGWKHIAMDKEGKVHNLDKVGMDKVPGYKPLDKIIRFSPRRATLQPGETQRVTFMLRRPPDAAPGEYRSHFLVQREPDPQTPETTTGNKEPNVSSKVSIGVLVSRSVPIYVLHGETQSSLSLLKAELKKNENRKKKHQPEYLVHFDVQKTGNRSVIGNADVFCTSGAEEVKINKVPRTFAVYAEGEFRKEKMAVQIPASGCNNMRIVIKGHSDDVHAGKLLAEGNVLK